VLAAGHRAAGLAVWFGGNLALDLPWWQVAAGAVVVWATSAGAPSPDADRAAHWPGPHRGITHWWGTPACAGGVLLATTPPPAQWAILAAWAGWTVHIIADAAFGRVPLWPRFAHGRRWHRAGLGMRTGGTVERYATPVLQALAGWLLLGLLLT
jgi:hypothetical protein